MTTPSKAEQKRPKAIYSGGVIYAREKIYIASEADAIFESLETELADTRRALELAIEWTNEDEPEKSLHYTFEEFIDLAIKEQQ